jgi:hypothetical protein
MNKTMNNHLPEHFIETYFLNPEAVASGEKDRMEAHCKECSLCSELFETTAIFYKELNAEIQRSPSEKDEELVGKLNSKRRLFLPGRSRELKEKSDSIIEGFTEIIELYRGPIHHRIIRLVRSHPVSSAIGGIGLAAAVIGLLFFVLKPFRDNNPAFAKINNYVLTVYNKNAESLWTKNVIGIPDCTAEEPPAVSAALKRTMLVGDIDDDGKNELVFSNGNNRLSQESDSLFCFDFNGTLRWAIGTGRYISFGDTAILQHTARVILDFFILKRQPASRPQLFTLSMDRMFSPGKLFEVDPLNGNILQNYYCRGGATMVLTQDIDHDGKMEIVMSGVNDGFNRTYIAVLDPANIEGYAPVPVHYLPINVPKAIEKYYVLFPRTFLNHSYSSKPYNCPVVLRYADGSKITIEILEKLDHFPNGTLDLMLVYLLDSSLKVESVAGGDAIIKAQDYLLAARTIKKPFIPEYYKELIDSVQYWDGDKFVNTPMMNNYYKEVAANS